jgi:hypothetical protein
MDRDQLWEEGEYEAKPVSLVYKESAAKGTPYMEVSFNVDGKTKTCNLWLTEAAENSTLNKLKALGFNGDFYESPAIDITLVVSITCKHEEYNGKWKEAWSYWGSRSSPIDKAKAAALTARYRAAGGTVSKAPSRPAPKPAATEPPRPTPKPPAPKPAAPSPAEEVVASNANEAWAHWLKIVPEQGRDEAWIEICKQYGDRTGDESKIKPNEWDEIAKTGGVPF